MNSRVMAYLGEETLEITEELSNGMHNNVVLLPELKWFYGTNHCLLSTKDLSDESLNWRYLQTEINHLLRDHLNNFELNNRENLCLKLRNNLNKTFILKVKISNQYSDEKQYKNILFFKENIEIIHNLYNCLINF